jgi:hypothetical protein
MGSQRWRPPPTLWTQPISSTGSSEDGQSTSGWDGPTRPHDDIDVLVWRRDQARVHEALTAAGWAHTPTSEDRLGTNYVRDGFELQLTFVVPGPDGPVMVRIPEQPIVLPTGRLQFVRRELQGLSARVLTREMMLAANGSPRPDDLGGAKDQADLTALRAIAADPWAAAPSTAA